MVQWEIKLLLSGQMPSVELEWAGTWKIQKLIGDNLLMTFPGGNSNTIKAGENKFQLVQYYIYSFLGKCRLQIVISALQKWGLIIWVLAVMVVLSVDNKIIEINLLCNFPPLLSNN